MELSKYRVLPITGKVQHYAWGGFYYLPKLLNIPVKKGETYAEFWLGAHDRGSSELKNGTESNNIVERLYGSISQSNPRRKSQMKFLDISLSSKNS